ncbi:MAG TPA: beta-propeller fold lactonase family protein [Gemmatimonadaceae bacterium]|nr:beta-propeller fold lactonase family protein [Gemmatimonadaceae bacterium]
MRRALQLGLTILAVVSCETTDIASSTGDRVIPEVSVAITDKIDGAGAEDSVSVRRLLRVAVNAEDNAGLINVLTSVYADTGRVRFDSAGLAAGAVRYARELTFDITGVRSGQRVRVVTVATDAGGNTATAEAFATAFDPFVPKVGLLAPDVFVIQGGTYSVNVLASDTTGLTKIGYRVNGAVVRADSSLLTTNPRSDTANYNFSVPGSTPSGSIFTVSPFAENSNGLRSVGTPFTVRVQSQGVDLIPPTVYQTVPARLETTDSLEITARDSDGLIRVVGFIAKNTAGQILYRSADTLTQPAQQIVRKKIFNAPTEFRGQTLFITAYATDMSGRTGYAIPTGATIPVAADSLAKRDQIVYAYGLTFALPPNALGGDIAVDTVRNTVYVSNINDNKLEVFAYSSTLTALSSISVGSMPWGMAIDNSGSVLFVANSGGTNISRVNLLTRREDGRVKTSNEWVYDIQWSTVDGGGFKYSVRGPIDYSDRPQYIAQSASGALYYSTRPTSEAEPGTLRRIDNYLDSRSEPRQLWQYGYRLANHYVVINSDGVYRIPGGPSAPDSIMICEHTPGQELNTSTCVIDATVPGAVAALKAAPVNGNVEAVFELDVESLALPDTNFVAVGGDRRRVAFGEANTESRAGRVMLVTDPQGTPPDLADYSAGIEIRDLTNNASDRVFGIAINGNSTNIGVHGAETFFADSSLRLQGKFATFNDGAGIAFHPRNVQENTPDLSARVVFVASGDKSIQIVDSYSYRLRGRIPIRTNLYGPLRAVVPTAAERASDPSLVVKLFGLTPEGIVVVDVRQGDILPP